MGKITEIEEMNYENAKANVNLIEEMEIKGHQVLFVDFGDAFGYSALVFKNGNHMHHANEYELHYNWFVKENGKDALHDKYVEKLNAKLFTESELLAEIKDYAEYQAKSYYLRNYWIMQFDYVSMWYIGEPDEEQKKAKKKWHICHPCFAYVPDKTICNKANDLIGTIESQWEKVKNSPEVFREKVAYELSNHEYCITTDYSSTLAALGLDWNELENWQRQIFKEEGDKQVDWYLHSEEA